MKAFLNSLLHAVVNGMVTGVATQAVGVNGFKQLGIIAGSSALGGVVSFLCKAPVLPWLNGAAAQ
jgi:hypothetical protein